MNPKVSEIPIKFDIWDTHYTLTDYGNRMVVKSPCRKYEKKDPNSWGLGFYEEETTDALTISFLRRMIENNKAALFSKHNLASFNIAQVLAGMPQEYGWLLDDFE